jgi:SLOG cluster3 family
MTTPHEKLTSLPHHDLLHGHAVFLSASFPSRERAPSFFESADPDEITQAIVATCRAVFSAHGRLVFGGHPSVTPLVMMVAEEYLPESVEERLKLREEQMTPVIAYQSESFREALPQSTRNLEIWGLGDLRWINAKGATPRFTSAGTLIRGSADPALQFMRERMLDETKPIAGVFIGGMEGIYDEADLFRDVCKGWPLYFIGAPGGAARDLAERESLEFTSRSGLSSLELAKNRSYPALLQRVVIDTATRL